MRKLELVYYPRLRKIKYYKM